MASYGLKYWWQKDRDRVTVRLEIQQRGYSGTAKEIYALQSLSLELQGGDDAIDSPIIKTSLNVGLVDASDMPDTSTVKYGDWTEFFTPDSTLYRFVLKQGGTTRWTGYLTPDSYEENLTYRNTISVTARDNIGHLQDFDFDGVGYITVYDLIAEAFQKIDFPMTDVMIYDMDMEDADGGDVSGLDRVLVNSEAFMDKSWYDALSGVLESLGMALRYIDNNRVCICPLRHMPELATANPVRKQIEFLNSSGHRMMTPAIKMIDETFTYDIKDVLTIDMQEDSFEEAAVTIDGTSVSAYRPVSGRWRQYGNIVCLNNYLYGYKEVVGSRRGDMESQDALYLSVYPSGETEWSLHYMYASANVPFGAVLEIAFQISSRLFVTDNADKHLCTAYSARIISLKFFVTFTGKDNSGKVYTMYYNGEDWQEDESIMTLSVTHSGSSPLNVFMADASYRMSVPDGGTIMVALCGFGLTGPIRITYGSVIDNGGFCTVSGLTIKQVGVDGYKSRKTRTVYDEINNGKISRSPSVGQVPSSVSIDVFVNGLYQAVAQTGYPPVIYWSWQDRPGEGKMPLAMIVHKQILMYHSRTSSILTGTIRDVTSGDPRFDNIYIWEGRKFLLTGGTLDMLTGHVNNATLRDYEEYEDLWLLENTMKFDRNSVSAPAGGGTVSVGVIANVQWEAVAYLEGKTVSVSPASGSGNATLSVSIPANGTTSAREGYIRLASHTAGVNNVTCDIHQAASALVFNVSPLSLQLDDIGATQYVTVETNDTNWTASADVEWLELITDREHGILHVSADLNNGRYSVERSGNITVSAGSSTATVHVIQEGADAPAMIAVLETYSVEAEGGEVEVMFYSNGEKVTILLWGAVKYSRAELYLVADNSQTLLEEFDAPPAAGYLVNNYAIPGDPGASGLYGLLMRLWCEANDQEEEIECMVTARAITGDRTSDAAQSTLIQAENIPALKVEPTGLLLGWNGHTLDGLPGSVTVTAAEDWSYSVPDDGAWLNINRTGVGLSVSADLNSGRESIARAAMITVTSGQNTATVSVIQGINHTILEVYPVELPAGQEGTVSVGSNAQSLKFDFSSIPDTEVTITVVDNGEIILSETFTGLKEYTIPGDPGAEREYIAMLQFTPPAGSAGRSVTVTYRLGGEDKSTETITIA